MEILKRAKGDSGDLAGWNWWDGNKDIQEEVNHRTYKAGYTNREGGPRGHTKIISMPSTPEYRKNYVKIFGHD